MISYSLKRRGTSRIPASDPLAKQVAALARKAGVEGRGATSVTLHLRKLKDGSVVVVSGSDTDLPLEDYKLNHGVTVLRHPSNGTGPESRIGESLTQTVSNSESMSTSRMFSQTSSTLLEESLEETRAIGRNMDENLKRNKEFYQSLKRLVTP